MKYSSVKHAIIQSQKVKTKSESVQFCFINQSFVEAETTVSEMQSITHNVIYQKSVSIMISEPEFNRLTSVNKQAKNYF